MRAQDSNRLIHKTIHVYSDSLQFDSLPIAFGSFKMYTGEGRLESGYSVNYTKNYLYLDSSLIGQTFTIEYRRISLKENYTFYHKSKDYIEPVFSQQPRAFYDYRRDKQGNAPVFGDGLNVSGNIARGIGFGNNQDVVLNSNLNLQLNGRLGSGFSILAAISDENNPIQPQGNTQQIQDFDKVFISIIKDSNTLTVGDFLMQTGQEHYFMKFYKKSRGLQLDLNKKGKINHHVQANAAVSRGKFARNEIQGQEGMQGPYRLQGANGELNIIVISGTEVVYIDGEKVERGQQNDYVIDYNTGEIIFMPGRLITKFNRLVIEFQYSDRNYSRSVFTLSDLIRRGKWSASINYFSEQDNKLQPTDTSNNSKIRTILEQAGDGAAIFENEVKYNTLQPDRVNYRKIDTLGYRIYQYSNQAGSDTAFYTTVFSFVGSGKGNYKQVASSANGRVFTWQEPINGVPQGDYEPYVVLVAPKRLQMLTAGVAYRADKKLEVNLEGAYSNDNQNSFSGLDKRNDDGLGLFFSIKQKDLKYRSLRLNSQAKVEFINQNFKYVERYRSVEFNRIWNRQLSNTGQSLNSHELISTLNTRLQIKDKHNLLLEASNYNRGELFNGLRGMFDYAYSGKTVFLKLNTEQLQTEGLQNNVRKNNNFSLWKFENIYTFKGVRFGFSVLSEQSQFKTDTGKKLEQSSFKYEQVAGFAESKLMKHWYFKGDVSFRTDYTTDSNAFAYASSGTNLNGVIEHVGIKQNKFRLVGSFRNLSEASTDEDDRVILARVEYNGTFFKRFLNTSTYYQVGTGREQKRIYSFALVQSGNGTHTWNDYNGNGIEEINEFEPAIYADQAKYVKIYLPSNEFIQSNTNEFNQNIRLQAPMSWQSAGKWKRFASKFNTITSYKADRRITDNRLETILNPLKLNINDSALIAVNSLIKQTTFFNRSNAVFGLEHNIQTSQGKQFLNSGFEWRQTDKQQIVSRLAFSRRLNLVLDMEQGRKQNRNQFFENRNYNYTTTHLQPELFYQTQKGVRLGTYFKYTEAFNAPEYGNDKAFINEAGLEIRYFIINKGNIDAKLATHQINFQGNSNSPLAFDILNGLSNGQNLTWNIGFGGKTKGNIQFNVSYEGRKTSVFKTIHIGRAEARYIF